MIQVIYLERSLKMENKKTESKMRLSLLRRTLEERLWGRIHEIESITI